MRSGRGERVSRMSNCPYGQLQTALVAQENAMTGHGNIPGLSPRHNPANCGWVFLILKTKTNHKNQNYSRCFFILRILCPHFSAKHIIPFLLQKIR